MEFPCGVQVVGVVTFMDADGLLLPVRAEKGLKAAAPLLGLGNASVAIILAEWIVSHRIFLTGPLCFVKWKK